MPLKGYRKIAGKFRKGFWGYGAFWVLSEQRGYYKVNGSWYYVEGIDAIK